MSLKIDSFKKFWECYQSASAGWPLEKTLEGLKLHGVTFPVDELEEGNLLKYVTFENCTFHWVDFDWVNFDHVTFENCIFEDTAFDSATLVKTTFNNCDFAHTSFPRTTATQCLFDMCHMGDSQIGGTWMGCQISRCALASSSFENWDLVDSPKEDTTLVSSVTETSFNHAYFGFCTFKDVNFWNPTFTECGGLRMFGAIVQSSRDNALIQWEPYLDLVTTGCFSGTMDMFKQKLKCRHKENKYAHRYLKALDYMKEAYKDFEKDPDIGDSSTRRLGNKVVYTEAYKDEVCHLS